MTKAPVSWIAPDPGPPYLVTFALASEGVERGRLQSLLLAHLPVIGWHEMDDPRGVVAITGLQVLSPTHDDLARHARESAVLVLTDGPLADLDRLPGLARGVVEHEAAIRRIGCSHGGVARPVEVAAVAALRSIPLRDRIAYVRTTLGRILALPEKRANLLLETIEGITRDLNIQQLAASLCLHEKSVIQRRRRIAQLTGLRPWIAGERFHLVLGFLLWQLDRADSLPVGSRHWSEA